MWVSAEHGDWLAKREALIFGSEKSDGPRMAISNRGDFAFEFVDDRPETDAVAGG